MPLTAEKTVAKALSPERLQQALRTFRDVGFVAIEDAFDLAFLEEYRVAYEAALDRYLDSRGGLDAMDGKTFGKNHVGFFPPLVPPFSDERIVAHPMAVQMMT